MSPGMLLALLESIKEGFRRNPCPDVAEGFRRCVPGCGVRAPAASDSPWPTVPESAARGLG